jgi:DNA-binding MarR family transcriptional regulator
MDVDQQPSWDDNVSYALVRLGHLANRRFAERLAGLGLRPRQLGLLDVLEAGPLSQLELAGALGVTPSVVVDMVDELEALDAVRRVRDTHDRRRQNLQLTRRGRSLGARALRLADQLDAELLAPLDDQQAGHLRAAIAQLAASHSAARRASVKSPES